MSAGAGPSLRGHVTLIDNVCKNTLSVLNTLRVCKYEWTFDGSFYFTAHLNRITKVT